jgi:GTP-binding protein
LNIAATFVTSAASAAGLPGDGLPEIALVGRSNVGKSTLINALVRQRIARTSAAPGKTRLANVYRVARGAAPPMYLVDLPGYGYARGGDAAAREFDALTQAYLGRERGGTAALLLVDARHPGLDSDRSAWVWLQSTVERSAIVATKIDKLSRAERQRAIRACEAAFEHPVLPVSAVTGEGLDQLWTLIDRIRTNRRTPSPSPRPDPVPPPGRDRPARPRRKRSSSRR